MPTKGLNALYALGDDGDFFGDDLPDPGAGDPGIIDNSTQVDQSQSSQASTQVLTDDPSVSNVSVDAQGNVSYTDSNGNPVTVTADMINAASPAAAASGASQVTGSLTGPAGAAVAAAQPTLQSDIASAMSSGNVGALAALAKTALQVYQQNGANALQMQRLQNSFALQQQRLVNSRAQMPILLFAGVAVAFLIMRSKEKQ